MVNTEHLFEEVSYFPEKNENENQIINKLEEIVQPNKREEYPKRLFVDFTGGNRSSALTVVFACRILDKYGMEVGKILYSNLRNTENGIVGRIEECTQTYRIFSEFERALMIENNIVMNVPESADEQIKDTEKKRKDMLQTYNLSQDKEWKKKSEELLVSVEKEINNTERSYAERKSLRPYKNR